MHEGHEGEAPGFDIPIFTEEFLDHNKGNFIIIIKDEMMMFFKLF